MPKGSGVTTPSAQRKVVRYLVTCPDTNSTPGLLSQHRRVPKARKWYNAIATADAEICSFGGKWKFARLWSVQGIFVTLLSGQRQQLTKTSFGLIRPLLAEKGQRPRKLDSRLGLRLSPMGRQLMHSVSRCPFWQAEPEAKRGERSNGIPWRWGFTFYADYEMKEYKATFLTSGGPVSHYTVYY